MTEPGQHESGGVDSRLHSPHMVAAAAELASLLLNGNAERVAHSAGLAERAQLLTAAVTGEEAPLLMAAAWLHDIGYADTLRVTRFHPVDGGLYLRRAGWPPLVCGLVAHHSGARFVPAARGLSPKLSTFAYREDPLSDALTVADQTAGPGRRSTGSVLSVTSC